MGTLDSRHPDAADAGSRGPRVAPGPSTLSSKRHGLDLVGRSHEFRQPRKSKKPAGEASRLDRPPGILSHSRGQARTPEATRFDELPRNQPWNSESEFSHSRNQRQGES